MVISARQDNWAPNIGTSRSMNDMPTMNIMDLPPTNSLTIATTTINTNNNSTSTISVVDSSPSNNGSAPTTPG